MALLLHDWAFCEIPVQVWLAVIELSDSANASSESSMALVKLALEHHRGASLLRTVFARGYPPSYYLVSALYSRRDVIYISDSECKQDRVC